MGPVVMSRICRLVVRGTMVVARMRRHRRPARMACDRTDECNQAGQDGA